jgi:hypothetical protein
MICLKFYAVLCYTNGRVWHEIGDQLIPVLKKIYSRLRYAKNFAFLCVAAFACFAAAASANNAVPMEPAALDFANVRSLWEIDPNLTGKGISIGAICRSMTYINDKPQNDFRFNMNHNSLYDADVSFSDGTDGRFGISEHATSIAGIMLGLEDNATHPDRGIFNYRGTSPDASVNVYEFNSYLAQLYARLPIKEDIVVLSLGQMFEEWWTRALEQAAAEKDFLVVASVGNGASVYTPKPLYPGAGSNVLGVGVVDAVTDADGNISLRNFSTPKAANSSVGPTEDERCKPDIVAPGTALIPTADTENGYKLETNWSSLAGPIVAGTAALLEQKALSGDSLKNDFDQPGKSLVLKAVLMNSARKLPFWHKGQTSGDDDQKTPLDHAQGAGLLDGLAAQKQLTAGKGKPGPVKTIGWDNRVLQDDELGYMYGFNVIEPNQIITATLCWNRVYRPAYPFDRLLEQDTDLRLELWGVDPDNPENRVLLDYSDSVNDNIEHIYFACSSDYPAYALRVRFNEQPSDAFVEQRFALAWSVGPDRQVNDPWWYDLNADNQIDEMDKLIYVLIDNNTSTGIDKAFLEQALIITPERIQLLSENWREWKSYLTKWETSE